MTDLSKLVRPLVWRQYPDSRYSAGIRPDHWITDNDAASVYEVTRQKQKWGGAWTARRDGGYHCPITAPTLKAAQASAQADYTARILAALDTDAVRGLVEAANQARLAFAGYVSADSAIRKLDAALARLKGGAPAAIRKGDDHE